MVPFHSYFFLFRILVDRGMEVEGKATIRNYSVIIIGLQLTVWSGSTHSCHVVCPLFYVIFSFLLDLVGRSREVEG